MECYSRAYMYVGLPYAGLIELSTLRLGPVMISEFFIKQVAQLASYSISTWAATLSKVHVLKG